MMSPYLPDPTQGGRRKSARPQATSAARGGPTTKSGKPLWAGSPPSLQTEARELFVQAFAGDAQGFGGAGLVAIVLF